MTAERAVLVEPPRADVARHSATWARRGLSWVSVTRFLLASDAFAIAVCVLVGRSAWQVSAVSTAALLLSFCSFRLYRSRLSPSLLDDMPSIAASGAIAIAVGLGYNDLFGDLSLTSAFVNQMAVTVLFVVWCRALTFTVVRWARRSGRVEYSCLVIGADQVGRQLVRTLQAHKEFGLDVVGFVDEVPADGVDGLPAPLLGGDETLPAQILAHRAEVAIVAFGGLCDRRLIDVLRTCDRLRCEIFLVPRLYEVHSTTRDMEQVWGIPLVRVRRAPYRQLSWRLKRLTDIVVAAVALVVCAPLLAACALAVRIETGPGVLFRQYRVGRDNRSFCLLKFRSLKPATSEEAATTWNVAQDDRMGPVGRLLRRTSLDELPQLWNILRGDMSLVGPRPERPHFVEQFQRDVPRYSARHRVNTGLTGWAQVHGLRGDTSIEDRALFDNYYIENWSLWGDIKIMIRTVHQVFRRGDH